MNVGRPKLMFVVATCLFGMLPLSSGVWADSPGEVRMAGEGYVPKEGLVPDEDTAKHVAIAILAKIYGRRKIDSEQPFQVELKAGVWTVKGSLPAAPPGDDVAGGVAIIKLSKADGRVLYVNHEK